MKHTSNKQEVCERLQEVSQCRECCAEALVTASSRVDCGAEEEKQLDFIQRLKLSKNMNMLQMLILIWWNPAACDVNEWDVYNSAADTDSKGSVSYYGSKGAEHFWNFPGIFVKFKKFSKCFCPLQL